MMQELINGEVTRDKRLDRVRRYDIRSLDYTVAATLPPDAYTNPISNLWKVPVDLDQGDDGACVGFGFTHELISWKDPTLDARFAKEEIYWNAQREDDWPGGSYPGAKPVYEGTSVLTGAKVCQEKGFYSEYRWALDVNDVIGALGYHGPVVIGIDWYEGMDSPDANGFVKPTGKIRGGHCTLLMEVGIAHKPDGTVDQLASYFTIHNSWGPSWAINGRAHIYIVDFLALIPGSDMCVPVHA